MQHYLPKLRPTLEKIFFFTLKHFRYFLYVIGMLTGTSWSFVMNKVVNNKLKINATLIERFHSKFLVMEIQIFFFFFENLHFEIWKSIV